MKKLVSLILIVILVVCVGTVGVSAQGGEEKQLLYKDKFIELSGIPEYDPYNYYWDSFTYYDELYYHKNEQGENDWVLFYVMENCFNPTEAVFTMNVGNRYIKWWAPAASYPYGYGVYDIANNTVHDISMTMYYGGVEDIEEVFEELEIGYELGDVNKDKTVSVLDATEIQFYVAKLKEIANDDYSFISAISDADRDGEMSITDATAIQMKLAKIEEEPKYNEDLVYSALNNMDPNDAVWQQIEFEVLYNGKQEIEDCKKHDSTFAAIIKTKEQYDEIFAVYNDVYDEKFFEDNWLVASVYQVTDERMVAQISELYVSYNDFMIHLDKHIVGEDGIALPTAPLYYSFVAVNKSSVNDVKNIIWIK